MQERIYGDIVTYARYLTGPLVGKWYYETYGSKDHSSPQGMGFNTLEWARFYAYVHATTGRAGYWDDLN